jgi:hypothetical protein
MTDLPPNTPSVVDRTRQINVGASVVGVHFLGRTAAFVLGEEALYFVPEEGEERRVPVHGGGILSAGSDGARVVTGGDDGQLAATGASGEVEILAIDEKRRWIDRVALGPDGAVAWSAGKTAYVRTGKGDVRTLDVPSSVGGLAFAPKGVRLAIAHYAGVTLWFPNARAAPEGLAWKGSHHEVNFSPDGKFLLTAMQEPTLHGWRLQDRRHAHVGLFRARVIVELDCRRRLLATSGAEQLILWPFSARTGRWGRRRCNSRRLA